MPVHNFADFYWYTNYQSVHGIQKIRCDPTESSTNETFLLFNAQSRDHRCLPRPSLQPRNSF